VVHIATVTCIDQRSRSASWPSGSGLAGVDAADLVSGHLEAPVGRHLSPGVVAVSGEEMEHSVAPRETMRRWGARAGGDQQMLPWMVLAGGWVFGGLDVLR
jgi:hypothetical protein